MNIVLRSATRKDAPALHALIQAHLAEGHLLPRTQDDLAAHAPRFIVAVRRSRRKSEIVGCAELAPLSTSVAEVRSLVVDQSARDLGIGRQLVDQLQRRAVVAGFDQLCAFTHNSEYFVRKGFTVVPHSAVPEKIEQDCRSCALFPRCGQHAVVLPLAAAHAHANDAAIHVALRG